MGASSSFNYKTDDFVEIEDEEFEDEKNEEKYNENKNKRRKGLQNIWAKDRKN